MFSYKGKQHNWICDKKAIAVLTTHSNTVTYPVGIVSVQGVKCGALIDTGAGSSHTSSKFVSLIYNKPVGTETKRIQTLMNSLSKRMSIYSA